MSRWIFTPVISLVFLAASGSALAAAQTYEGEVQAAPAPPGAPAQAAPPPVFVQTTAAAAADPEPSTGLGMVIAGWVVSGIGVLNLASIPVCSTDLVQSDTQDACTIVSAVVGGVGLAVGVPLLIIGYNQRSDHAEWRERHPRAQRGAALQFAMQRRTPMLVLSGNF